MLFAMFDSFPHYSCCCRQLPHSCFFLFFFLRFSFFIHCCIFS